MASEAEEQRRADMLRERREAGDKAWSPSKAREALRAYAAKHIQEGHASGHFRRALERAESYGLANMQEFDAFCVESFGQLLAV